jgi:hypothetical protein
MNTDGITLSICVIILNMIEKYLMSFVEYQKKHFPTPYSYSIQKDRQMISYFGVRHCFDPQDTQFDALRKFWHEFLDNVDRERAIVFVEGGMRPLHTSENEAILSGGEAHYITYLSHQENIATFSPEPPEKLRLEILNKRFSKEEIMYYEYARTAHQWNRMLQKPNFEKYIQDSLEYTKERSDWHDFDISLDHMERIQKNIFHRDVDKNDIQFFYDAINPTTTFSRINELSRFEDSGLRDVYILQQIEKYWHEGKSIFIVYGKSHAVMHEPALKMLI